MTEAEISRLIGDLDGVAVTVAGEPPGPTDIDFTALDQLMPHPVYAKQSWVSILVPGDANRDRVAELVADTHAGAVERHTRKADRRHGDR